MKLAVSQIAWQQEEQQHALKILQKYGFSGLEIAPTMFVGENPYKQTELAKQRANEIAEQYGLCICSMQSIWFGQTGNMFEEARAQLLAYSKEAIRFAKGIGAGNLVFGSPRNRNKPEGTSDEMAIPFFAELGDFAASNKTVFSLEANPPVYQTNFMNTTQQVLAMVEKVGSNGCKLNLDFGTIITNQEDIASLEGQVKQINHVHISEPQLACIQPREQHKQLATLLRKEGYAGYVSIEMKQQSLETLEKNVAYVAEVFG